MGYHRGDQPAATQLVLRTLCPGMPPTGSQDGVADQEVEWGVQQCIGSSSEFLIFPPHVPAEHTHTMKTHQKISTLVGWNLEPKM